jgi:hypothetical protein
MSIADRGFVWFPQSEMVKSYPEWADANRSQLFKKHRILAKDSSVYALIEIYSPED